MHLLATISQSIYWDFNRIIKRSTLYLLDYLGRNYDCFGTASSVW